MARDHNQVDLVERAERANLRRGNANYHIHTDVDPAGGRRLPPNAVDRLLEGARALMTDDVPVKALSAACTSSASATCSAASRAPECAAIVTARRKAISDSSEKSTGHRIEGIVRTRSACRGAVTLDRV
jgi:hypothetical protein